MFASSNHAVGFYPRHHRIGTDVTARPDSRYGVSKVFGEAVGALYADKHGLGVTCLRIGNFGEMPLDHRRLSIWLKPEDLVQLCRIGLDHPDIHFEIFYGASYNERAWWDNHRAYELGYRPTGRGEDFREHAMAEQAKLKPDPVGDFYQGGTFCSMEFDGDKEQDHRLEVRSRNSGLMRPCGAGPETILTIISWPGLAGAPGLLKPRRREQEDGRRTSQGTDELWRRWLLAVPAQGLHQGDGLFG